MAGESPDKSEQRRSPGETAAGGRDPRLAAFGDAAPAGVDQPTAVFKAPKPPTDTAEPEPAKPSLVAQRQEVVTTGPAKKRDEQDDSDQSEKTGKTAPATGAARSEGDATDASPEGDDADAARAETDAKRKTDAKPAKARAAEADEADEDADEADAVAGDASDAADGAAEAPNETKAASPSPAPTVSSDKPEPEPEKPQAGSTPEPKPKADGAPAAAADADPDAGSGPSRPVDQPTAVFKAFGKRTDAAPAVDQPTTALKLPADAAAPKPAGGKPSEAKPTGAKPADGKPSDGKPSDGKPAPKWAAGADRDGERPGRFVPLRSDAPGTGAPASSTGAAKANAAPATAATPEPRKGAGSGTATDSRPASTPAQATGKAATATAGTATGTRSSTGAGTGAGTAPAGDAETTAAVTPPSLTEAERTKQQPLPPRPPLDMLAELTNTPPPPETPLRTLVRRVKIWTPLVVLLLIIFATVQLLRPLPDPALTLSAEPTYTFEGGELKMPWPTEGQGAVEVEGVGVIGTYGPQQPAPTASVAKAMTAYVILRDHPIKDKDAGEKLTIDQKTEDQASNPDWSTAPVKEGQQYTQGELLQLLMVRSANNVAHFLARWDAGSEEAFIKKMNAAAKDLGMTDTTYTDASGFDKGTVSTPKDQLKLAKAAMKFDAFRQIVDMPNVELPQIGRRLENGNTILLKDGVSGIKTGTSTPAGGNLLWSANTVVDGEVRRVIGVVMNVKSGTTLSEKTKLAVETYSYGLIKAAQDGVVSAVAVKKGDVVGYVDDGLGGRTPVVATEDLKPVGWAGLNVELTLDPGKDGKGGLPRTASAGTVVGELAVGTGEGRVSVPVAVQHQLEEPGFGAKLTRLG